MNTEDASTASEDDAEEMIADQASFYAAQSVAFADLRGYHAARPRRKRQTTVNESCSNPPEPARDDG